MTLRGTLIIGLLALIAALTWWLQGRVQAPETTSAASAEPLPDYFMDGFRILITDTQGLPQYRLSGAHLAHLAEDDTGMLRAPRLEYHPADGSAWTLSAESGSVGAGADAVNLHGGVSATRPAEGGQRAIRIDTERLTVYPQMERAETQALVVAQSEGVELTGKGLALDLKAGTFVLQSQVRGIYAP